MIRILVTELITWTFPEVLGRAKTPCLSWGGSFPTWICRASNETDAETETAQALFNSQRMEKLEFSLQINFSTPFGLKHHIYRRVEVKGKELSKEREECS